MEESLKGAMLEAGKHRWLDRALLRKTNFCDTHPALRDRVAFLNELARLPEAPLPSAADCYLGSTLNARLSFWDRQWTRHVSLAWAEKHKELRKNASRLEQLQERAALDADEQWEIASLTEALEGGDAAIPLIRVMIERNPAHVTALFNLGRLLVQRDDEEGIAYLEEAMKRDRKAILPACDWIARFWEDRGQPEKARAYWTQLEARGELMEKNAEERRRLSAKDTFLPHELSPAELEPILQRITGDSDIEAAYLVRKALKARMEDPLPLVLALLPRHAWYALDAHQTNHELQTRMAAKAPLPSAGIVVVLSSAQSALLRKIRKAPGAEIYRRGK
jgi:hypothetical protein